MQVRMRLPITYKSTPTDRFDDLGQDIDRADALIELPPAMVRHVDAVGPAFERDLGVLSGADALQHDRYVEVLLDPLDVAPVEAGLVETSLRVRRRSWRLAMSRSRRLWQSVSIVK